MTRHVLAGILLACLWSAALAPVRADSALEDATPPPIDDPAMLRRIAQVQQRVENLRGLSAGKAVPSSLLDSETLESLARYHLEKQFPQAKRQAIERLLVSIGAIPEGLDLLEMYLSLLDEQVGGLYDPESKQLYVRASYDIQGSQIAQIILAHEICHALQDHAYDLRGMGIEDPDNDDRAIATLSVAEGDATELMNRYAAVHGTPDILKELPGALLMDQSALQNAPHFFKQMLLFPYLQGQVFLDEAVRHGRREEVFKNPPQTTEQVIHPERFFAQPDEPSPLGLLSAERRPLPLPGLLSEADLPSPPAGFEFVLQNRFGEMGIRSIFEPRLGAGLAQNAAAGWDGDAYAVYAAEEGENSNWFIWETVWDSPADATEFAGAWVTLWRSLSGERRMGSLTQAEQTFQAGRWTVQVWRGEDRVLTVWHD